MNGGGVDSRHRRIVVPIKEQQRRGMIADGELHLMDGTQVLKGEEKRRGFG